MERRGLCSFGNGCVACVTTLLPVVRCDCQAATELTGHPSLFEAIMSELTLSCDAWSASTLTGLAQEGQRDPDAVGAFFAKEAAAHAFGMTADLVAIAQALLMLVRHPGCLLRFGFTRGISKRLLPCTDPL